MELRIQCHGWQGTYLCRGGIEKTIKGGPGARSSNSMHAGLCGMVGSKQSLL
jgi:hypothetical protein